MDIKDTVMQHVAQIENLARQLNDVEEVLSDVAINTKILMSLPGKFNTLIIAWDSVATEKQTHANLIKRLIKEEQCLMVMDATAEALAVTNVSQKNTKSLNNKIR
ncbi:copia [Lasius niger]|uniref:Copia n=1 Tax=Lasius niger TaxID=67767 RepID=A0A0J7K5T4_LASNI|nr:copia [Lasius niger]